MNNNAEKVDGMGGDFFHVYYGYGRLDVYNSLYQIKKDRGDVTIEGIHESEGLYHQIGEIVSDSQASQEQAVQTVVADGAGFVQYGPYVGSNITGNSYYSKFRLKTDAFGSSYKVARLEVLNTQNSSEWFVRDVYGTDFNSGDYHDFYVKFDKDSVGPIEYRIYSYGNHDFTSDFVETRINNRDNKYDYQSEDLYHQVGDIVYDEIASERFAVQVSPSDIGHAQYGPYASNLSKGKYRANFRIKTSSFVSNTDIAILEVFNHTNPQLSATHTLKASDFTKTSDYEQIGLYFNVENGDVQEYRVYALGNSQNISFKIDAVKITADIYSSFNLNFEAEDMPSQTGMIWSNEDYLSYDRARVAHANYDTPGYMVYGPYTQDLEDGENYYIKFRMKARLSNDNPIARVEAYNPGGDSVFVSRELTSNNFAENMVWQDFNLHFQKGNGGSMEFRVWFYANNDTYLDNIQVVKKSDTYAFYEAEDLHLGSVGTVTRDAYNQSIAVSSQGIDGAGYLVYGPYTDDLEPGHYKATFRVKNNGYSSNYLAKIDAVNVGGTGTYSYANLGKNDFNDTNFTNIPIEFDRTADGVMEFRVYSYGHTDISVDYITVEKIS